MSSRQFQFVELLHKKTDEETLIWKTRGPNAFGTEVADLHITIMESEPSWAAESPVGHFDADDFEPRYWIRITDREGDPIDEIDGANVDTDEDERIVMRIIRQTYHKARRQALGVNDKLDEIISKLAEA